MQSAIGSVMLLLLLQLPCTTRTTIWGQVAQVPSSKGVSKGGRTVHPRGKPSSRCRVIFGWVPQMECWRTALPIYPSMDVLACCQIQEERSREVNLSWLLTGPPKAGLGGGHIHHPAGMVSDIWWRNWGPLPSSICAKDIAWTPTMWARKSMEIMKDMSSLKDHLWQRKGEQSGGCGEPESASTCPSHHCNQASQRGRWDTSGEQELTKARETHQWTLAAATMLEECIERLSGFTTRMLLDICHCS